MKKCYNCGQKFQTTEDVHDHIRKEHMDSVPKDYSVERYYYVQRTGKNHGRCVVCKNKTRWNEKTNKYHRFCDNPKCKEKYRETFKKRMIGKHGKTTLLNDPEHQKKMLANRSISGEYKWSDGKRIPYVGTYEEDFLQFLDKFMEFPSSDIIAPSPHTYWYQYKGEKKFYIPDFFIPSLGLEVEVKDGGDNPNNHHKIQDVDKVKERKKDDVLKSQKEFSFIKVTNKEYGLFMELLSEMKESYRENGEPVRLFYGEEPDSTKVIRDVLEGTNGGVDDGLKDAIIDDDPEVLKEYITYPMPEELKDHVGRRILYHDLKDNGSVNAVGRREGRLVGELMANLSDEGIQLFERELLLGDYNMNGIQQALLDKGPSVAMEHLVDYTKMVALVENVITERAIKVRGQELFPVYVLLVHTGTTLSTIIKKVSNKPFSHASISFDVGLENMYSFGRDKDSGFFEGSFIRESIKEGIYKDNAEEIDYQLYATYITESQLDMMKDRLQMFIDNKEDLKYNLIGLIQHAMGRESSRFNKYFCSQFVDTVLQSAKPYFSKHSSLIHPYDYATHSDFHLVSEGKLHEYDPKKARRNTRNIAYKVPLNNRVEKPVGLFVPVFDLKKKVAEIDTTMDIPFTYASFTRLYPNKRYFFMPVTDDIKDSFIVDIVNGVVRFINNRIINITNINY